MTSHFLCLLSLLTLIAISLAKNIIDDVDNQIFGVDASSFSHESECHLPLNLLWSHSLDQPLITTPVVKVINGEKNIVSLSKHFVHVNEGIHGDEHSGWPFGITFSSFATSPLFYDVDYDCVDDIVAVTEDGQVLFLRMNGEPINGTTLIIPPYKIPEDWNDGVSFKEGDENGEVDEEEYLVERYMEYFSQFRKNKIFDRFTDDGIKSLDLFVPSGGNKMSHDNILYSQQYNLYLQNSEPTSNLISLPAHVLANPVIIDIDNDGCPDLIIPVSYYFDSHTSVVDAVASGIVVFDLERMIIKWEVKLDLTKDDFPYRGIIEGDISVADFDGDGLYEIIVGTGTGMVYIISHDGKSRTYPSLSLDPIYNGMVVDDVDEDGSLDIIATDISGNVVLFNSAFQEKWEFSSGSGGIGMPVIGDIDGDGSKDIIIATQQGIVWALNAKNGRPLPNFPIKLSDGVLSRIQLFALDPSKNTLHIIVHTTLGKIYFLDGKSGCYEVVDVGEDSKGRILFDDLNGNGYFDMIVSTIKGNIYCFSTPAIFSPMLKWTSLYNGVNQYSVQKSPNFGVQIQGPNSNELSGNSFLLDFEIIDKHKVQSNNYSVTIRMGRAVLFKNYLKSGKHSLTLPLPSIIVSTNLVVQVQNDLGQIMEGETPFHLNTYFYKPLKFILILPFLFLCFVIWYGGSSEVKLSN